MNRGRRDPPFQFQLHPSGLPRRWRNVVHRQRFTATLQQPRELVPTDNIGEDLTFALRDAIQQQIEDQGSVEDHHSLHFTIQANNFSHAFQSTTFTVGEFREDAPRLQTYLQSLAEKLNSNEEFEPNDGFTLEMTLINTPGRGGRGKGERKRKIGKMAIEKLLKSKQSVISIKNKDQLCCARAIVTMKSFEDGGREARNHTYRQMTMGRPLQERAAKELHTRAGVEEGACGIPELKKFQAALQDYQIKVLSVDKPHMIIFQGEEKEKKIMLIKVGEHYHSCTSHGGFLDRSYYCHECNTGYNTEDRNHQPCNRKWCPGCDSYKCKEFLNAKATFQNGETLKPKEICPSCHKGFYGDDCYVSHLFAKEGKRSKCEMSKKCLACKKVFAAAPYHKKLGPVPAKFKHRCGWAECPFCKRQQNQESHRCFIQPVDPEDDEPEIKCISPEAAESRTDVYVDEEGRCFVYRDSLRRL